MSNPTYGSDPQSGYTTGSTDPYDTGSTGAGAPSPYETGTTDPYATNVPYEPTDPNAPAVGGYATTGTGTYTTESYGTDTGIGGGSPSTKDVAKDEAGNVKDTAVDAGKQVAGTAKQEAANVAGEAKQQAKSLVGAATTAAEGPGVQPAEQAGHQPAGLHRPAAGSDPGPGARGRAAERPGAAGREPGQPVREPAGEQ